MLEDTLRRAEGDGPMKAGRHLPYFDCCGRFFRLCTCTKQGKLTIGNGRNIEDIGISRDEAKYLLSNDIDIVREDLDNLLPWFNDLDDVRREALMDLRFNLGPTRFRAFKNTLAFGERGDWAGMARQFRTNRRYFSQTKGRAERIANMIETGQPL